MKKAVGFIIVLLVLSAAYLAYAFWNRINKPNLVLEEKYVLYIPTYGDFKGVLDTMEAHSVLEDLYSFKWLANKKGYDEAVKPGRYVLDNGMTNNELVNKLRSGAQDPIRLVLHNVSGVYRLAGKLSKVLEADSTEFLHFLKDEEQLEPLKANPETVTAYFLPNTYELYWNSSPKAVLQRMQKEYNRFWTGERLAKAKALDMSPIEVITLAAIVESESSKNDEKPRVAGLYLNRLDRGMLLQSDPTSVYGYKLDHPDEQIRRVYHKHIKYDSPYNTYLYKGLPPGPIRVPALSTIDAVLDPHYSRYLYMAADPERPGYHNFAITHDQHLRNAAKYQRWANRAGVR